MTPLLRRLYRLAKNARLRYPLGRSCAMLNRHYNDGFGAGCTDDAEVEYMRRMQPSTATRWARHWLAGGAMKNGLRTRAEQAAYRADYWKRYGDIVNKMRREDRARLREEAKALRSAETRGEGR
jgi:hypothetical protein